MDAVTGTTPQSRSGLAKCWTITHYDMETPRPLIPECDVKYLIEGSEICPTTGRPHIQGYVWLKKELRPPAIVKLYPHISHFEKAKGTPWQNFTYCSKDKDFVEYGTRPKEPGSSSAQDEVYTEALLAETVDEGMDIIKEKRPRDYCLYGDRIEGNLKRAKTIKFVPTYKLADFNREPLDLSKAVLIHGDSDSGKTEFAVAHFQNPLVCTHMDGLKRLKPDHDGIVFDDMSFSHLPRETIIHLLDMSLAREIHARNTNSLIPAGTKKIFTHNGRNPFYDETVITDQQKVAIERRLTRVHVKGKLY